MENKSESLYIKERQRMKVLKLNRWSARLGLALLAASVSVAASAAPIALSGVTATADQGYINGVNATIDGDLGNTNGGWAVFDAITMTHLQAQTAVFTASAPVTASDLYFGLHHNSGFVGHSIEEFRISVTQDAVPAPGGTWTELTASSFGTTSNTSYLVDSGNNFLKQEGNPNLNADTYSISASTPFGNITGFRLEILNTGPTGGVGTSTVQNGNIVLNEFTVDDSTAIATADFIGDNIALNKPVATSGPLNGIQVASAINDGDTTTIAHPQISGTLGFTYTIDLLGGYEVNQIDLLNRDNCCPERLSNYRVSVLDAMMSEVFGMDIRTDGTNSGLSGVDTVNPGGVIGNFVQITNLSGESYNPQIAEVSVFGILDPNAPVNVALNKPTIGDVAFGFPTANGNDGNTSTFTHANNTNPSPNNPFWQVDLEGVFELDLIELVDRNDSCCDPNRLEGSVLTLLDADLNVLFTSNPITGLTPGNNSVVPVFVLDEDVLAGLPVSYIRIDGYQQYFQFAELRAFGVEIPEPASALVLMAGIGVLGLRRRSSMK